MQIWPRPRAYRAAIRCACIFCVWSAHAAVPNDDIANAEAITGTNTALLRANGGATKETGEPDHAGNSGGASVWFQWTAPFSGSVEWGAGRSSFNTLLAAYEGNSISNLASVAANDNDGTNSTSRFVFNAISNSLYYIAVDGFNGATGSISLTLTQTVGYFIPANEPRTDFWTTDGQVNSIVETNGLVFAGGDFSYVAKKATFATALNVSDLSAVAAFPEINGPVNAICSDGANGFFIAGKFTGVGGVTVSNFVHLRDDLTLDANFVAPTFSGGGATVRNMAVDRGVLYLSGDFTEVNGATRTYLAALDATNGQLTSWSPVLPAAPSAFAVAAEAVYVSPGATNISSVNRSNGVVSVFTPGFTEMPIIRALAVLNDTLYVGGKFTVTNVPPAPPAINGASRFNLVALNRYIGFVQPQWAPIYSGSLVGNFQVSALVASCDRIYVAGQLGFSTLGVRTFDAVNPLTGAQMITVYGQLVDASFATSITIAGSFAFLSGGSIPFLNSQGGNEVRIRRPVVGLLVGISGSPSGPSPVGFSAISPDLVGPGAMVAASGPRLLVAGKLLTGGVTRYNLAAFDSTTGRPTDFAPVLNSNVNHLVSTSNRLYVAGAFQLADRQTRRGFAAFDLPTGQLATNWSPVVTVTNTLGSVFGQQLALDSGNPRIFLGGNFTLINGTNRQFLAAVHTTTGGLGTFNVPVTNSSPLTVAPRIDSLAIASGRLYVGGVFTNVAGMERSAVAAITVNTDTLAAGWNPGPSFTNSPGPSVEVSAALPLGISLYMAGRFHQVGGLDRPGLARVNLSSGAVSAWNPAATLNGVAASGLASASLATDGQIIFVGGTFSSAIPARTNLAAFRADGSIADWNPGFVSGPRVFASGNKVFLSEAAALVDDLRFINPLRVFGYAGAPRVITDLPVQVVVTNGGTVVLSVAATGQGMLTYEWRRNGTNLAMGNGTTYTISNAATNDTGTYDVIISNAIGSVASGAADVVVSAPPSIATQPISQTVPPGTNVILSVGANGFPAPTFQWRLNGVNIPGANAASYTVTTNAQPSDGGSYNVLVANAGGVTVSSIATVLVSGVSFALNDNLPPSGFDTNAANGVIEGSNVGGTKETGETNHVGKVGGTSVWFIWQAPANGVATFRTRGSSFDTLLAVYTGNSVSNLTPIASDEDTSGFLTSEVSFSAQLGTNYAIAIDGFAGEQGNIVLAWTNDTSVTSFPRILAQPLSQTRFGGESATFSVTVAAMVPPPTYQWFFGCTAIAGANSSSLTVSNIFAGNVGNYYVRITASNGLSAASANASLQLGVGTRSIGRDKLEDLFLDDSGGGSPLKGEPKPLTSVSAGLGVIRSLSQDNTDYKTQQRETNHCEVIGGASAWIMLTPLTNGVCMVDTIGSQIDTVLAVYHYVFNSLDLVNNFITCDDNSAPDGLRSVVRFNVTQGVTNLIVVDSIGGEKGNITLNVRLGLAPNGGNTTANQTWSAGQTLTLTAPVTNGVPPPFFQWRFNGSVIFNATNGTFTIANVSTTNSGLYSVIVSNFAGAITNTVANVSVVQPFQLSFAREFTNGRVQLRVLGPAQAQVVEVTTNFMRNFTSNSTVWSPLFTNPNGTPLNYVAPATNLGPQLYRTRSFP